MKPILKIIVSASAASFVASAGLAQGTLNSTADRPNDHNAHHNVQGAADRLIDAAKASDVIGMTVKNYQDEKLGKVEELAVDVESGRVVLVILSTGGFLGMGDKLSAVPPGSLHHDVGQKVLHLDADKEKLKSAPKFELSNWAEYSDSNHLSEAYGHYGQAPALTFIGGNETDGTSNTVTRQIANGTPAAFTKQNRSMISSSGLSQIQKASKVIGSSVNNLQDEKLGKVDNLLVDLPAGRIVAVIVSTGGFLGLGDELSAVPPTALKFTADRDTLQLDASKEALAKAPHFKGNEWPDFSQPDYANGVYQAYQAEPYFRTNANTRADNTARNVRDRNSNTLTPFDQSNGQSDVDTSAQIRKEITADHNLSVNAHNIKIMTVNGRVTLRGAVNTAEEKGRIQEIADRVARPSNVDNQLEVKLAATGRN